MKKVVHKRILYPKKMHVMVALARGYRPLPALVTEWFSDGTIGTGKLEARLP